MRPVARRMRTEEVQLTEFVKYGRFDPLGRGAAGDRTCTKGSVGICWHAIHEL